MVLHKFLPRYIRQIQAPSRKQHRRRKTRKHRGGFRSHEFVPFKKKRTRQRRRRTRRKHGGSLPDWLDGVDKDYIWNDTTKRSDWYVLPKKKNNIRGMRKATIYPHFHGGKNWINFSFSPNERVVLKKENTLVIASKVNELEKSLASLLGTPDAKAEWKIIIATLKNMPSTSGRRSPSRSASSSRPKVRVSGKGKSHDRESWAEAAGKKARSRSPKSPSFIEQQIQTDRENKARKEAERVAREADEREALQQRAKDAEIRRAAQKERDALDGQKWSERPIGSGSPRHRSRFSFAAVSNDENTSGDENTAATLMPGFEGDGGTWFDHKWYGAGNFEEEMLAEMAAARAANVAAAEEIMDERFPNDPRAKKLYLDGAADGWKKNFDTWYPHHRSRARRNRALRRRKERETKNYFERREDILEKAIQRKR